MKLKHIFISIPIIVLLVVVALLYTSFYGNPIAASKATQAITEYVEKTYPDQGLIVDRARYNFKFGNYWSKVHCPTSIDTYFNVEHDDNEIEADGYEWSVLSARNTMSRFEDEYTGLVQPLIVSLYGEKINRVKVFYADEETHDIKPELDEPFVVNDVYPKYLMVNINHDTATLEDFAQRLLEIHDLMQRNGYEFDTYTLYIEIDGRAYHVNDIPTELVNDDLIQTLTEANEAGSESSFRVDFQE